MNSEEQRNSGQPETKTLEPVSELQRLWTAPVGGESPKREGARSLVAECIEDRHPTLQGRIRVRWIDDSGGEQDRWVPALAQLAVRVGDRVLLIVPDNWAESLAVGVVDGFAMRPEAPRQAAAVIAMKSDEVLRVQDSSGLDVLEVSSTRSGPVVRLLQKDMNIELPGALRIKADSVEMTARSGPVSIQASDDVIVKGELVRLN